MQNRPMIAGDEHISVLEERTPWLDRSMWVTDFNWREAIFPRSMCLWLAGLWIAINVIRPWEVLLPSLESIRFERVFCLFALVAFVVAGRLRFRSTVLQSLLVAMLSGFVLASVFSYQGTSPVDVVYRKLGTMAVLFVVIASSVDRLEDAVFLILAYASSVTAYIAKCEWEFMFHGRGDVAMGVLRMQGIDSTFSHPNAVAGTALLALPSIYFLFQMRRHVPAHWLARVNGALGVSFGVTVWGIILTGSRAGMLGIGVFVLLACLTGRSVGRALLIASALLIVGILVWQMAASEEHKNRLRTLWDSNAGPSTAQASLDTRKDAAIAAWTAFERNPLTGVGPASFQEYRVAEIDGSHMDAHNIFAELLASTGLAGTGPFFLFIVMMLTGSRGLRQKHEFHSEARQDVANGLSYAIRNTTVLLILTAVASTELRFVWFLFGGILAGLQTSDLDCS